MYLLYRFRELLLGRERLLAYAIAAFSVAICWGVIIHVGDTIKSDDEPAFLAIATNLASNWDYAEVDGTLTAYRAPGMAFFLAPFVKMGAGIVKLRMVNALLVGFGLVILFHLIRRNAGPMAGLFAVALIPAWPVIIYAATTIYPQTLAAFLLVLTVWLLDRLTFVLTLKASALAGLTYGFLVLTIPIVLLLFPVFFGWILFRSKRRLAHAVIFCLFSGSMVSSWTVRNYVAFDAFIPIATSSGYNFLAGNAPNARYNTSLNIRFPEYVYSEIRGNNEVEKNNIFTRAAVKEIRQNPVRAVKLYFGKFVHWFHFSNKLLSDVTLKDGASEISVETRDIVLFISYCGIVGPLLLHIILIRNFSFKPIELLIFCLWIGAGLSYSIFFTRVRFRIPFDWLIIASNGIFLAALVQFYSDQWREKIGRAKESKFPNGP